MSTNGPSYFALGLATGLLLFALSSLAVGEPGRLLLIGSVVAFALAVVFALIG